MIKRGLCLIFAVICVACSSAHQQADDKPTLVGYRLIDSNQPEQAIEHFQFLLDHDPQNLDYRRGLSSAYALRGGFKAQMLLPLMAEIQKADHLKRSYETVSKVLTQNPKLSAFTNLIAVEIEMVVLLKKFDSVPTPNAEQAKDLKMAASLLSSLPSTTQGDYLYMAVINALLLKGELSLPVKIETCDQLVALVQKRGAQAVAHYSKILVLLKKANPSKNETYDEQLQKAQNMSEEISGLTATSLLGLSFLDHASKDPQISLFLSSPGCH